jgi:hypothetical protein
MMMAIEIQLMLGDGFPLDNLATSHTLPTCVLLEVIFHNDHCVIVQLVFFTAYRRQWQASITQVLSEACKLQGQHEKTTTAKPKEPA